MNYLQAEKIIKKHTIDGMVFGLDNIRNILNIIGNPQDDLKIIHIAGTNGKGSVGAFIATILAYSGYKTGRYISPAVFDEKEIIQTISVKMGNVFTEFISEEEVIEFANLIDKEDCLLGTEFELSTVMAFYTLKRRGCEFAVIETGLGGRLDATNVINNPICEVLTSIGLDHVNILGNTIEEITEEKCGIIKKNSIVVALKQCESINRIIEEKTAKGSAELVYADRNDISDIVYNDEKSEFILDKYHGKFKIKLKGRFQIENALIAIKTIEALNSCGIMMESISEHIVKKGLLETVWKGRFEKVSNYPEIYIDGAHNESAAYVLKECIQEYLYGKKLIYVTGMFKDKDVNKVASIMGCMAEHIFTFTTISQRAILADDLAKIYSEYCDNVVASESVKQALDKAICICKKKPDYSIICFGSLSFLKDIKVL